MNVDDEQLRLIRTLERQQAPRFLKSIAFEHSTDYNTAIIGNRLIFKGGNYQ